MLHGDPWRHHRTMDCILANTKGEQAGCPVRALPPGKQRGRCVTARARRKGVAAISAPETASLTKLWADCQLLTTSSWDPGRFTSPRRVTAWDQLTRGDTQHTWDCALTVHPGNGEQVQAGRTDCLTLSWPHAAHNSSREIPRYIVTIIIFLIKMFFFFFKSSITPLIFIFITYCCCCC